jgi:hypothetical protein
MEKIVISPSIIYLKKGLHNKSLLILGCLTTIEIFDLFQTWQLSIRSWSIEESV